jgi:hypothetical protein
MTGLPNEHNDTHSGTRYFFVSNVLFSSLFFLGLFWILQSRLGLYGPMVGSSFSGQFVLMMILSLLSFIGATGILVSLRRLGGTGLWAVPACIVTFSLVMGTLGQVVLLLTSPRTSSFTGFFMLWSPPSSSSACWHPQRFFFSATGNQGVKAPESSPPFWEYSVLSLCRSCCRPSRDRYRCFKGYP